MARAQNEGTQCWKVLYIVPFYSKYTRALTLENVCHVHPGISNLT